MAKGTLHDYQTIIRSANQFFRLLKCDCINGYGIGLKREGGKRTHEPCIVIFVNQKLPLRKLPLVNRIPTSISIPDDRAKGGVIEIQTDVEEARFVANTNRDTFRPAPGGVSISRRDQVAAGTLGGLVYDLDTDFPVILSNNHVLADTNLGSPGDEIVQPGLLDDPNATAIATLTRWIQIYYENEVDGQGNPRENLVDAAIATPINPNLVTWGTTYVGPQTPAGEPRLLTDADLGLSVQKSGRTTEHTFGFVQALNATVRVKYDLFQKAIFVDQIIVSQNAGDPDFSDNGDSGSLVYDMNARCIGLLFAGSSSTSTTPATTIVTPLRNVYRALHLRSLEAIG